MSDPKEAARIAMDNLQYRLTRIHAASLDGRPKQAFGEMVASMMNMPDWEIARIPLEKSLAADKAQAEQIKGEPVIKKHGTGVVVNYEVGGFPNSIHSPFQPITLAYEGLVMFDVGRTFEIVNVMGNIVVVKQAVLEAKYGRPMVIGTLQKLADGHGHQFEVPDTLPEGTYEIVLRHAAISSEPQQPVCSQCKGIGYYDEGHENDDGSMSGGNYVECERCGLTPDLHTPTHWCDNQSFQAKAPVAAPAPDARYQYVLRLCAHISGCTEAQVDAKITKVMAEMSMRES